jgi:hypothetical protein
MSSQIHSAERHRHCHIAIACLRQIRARSCPALMELLDIK